MRRPFFILALFCTTTALAQSIDVQGHRGCRGLYPENTLPAFMHALELGVTTLELDVVISGDGQVVVSHEPWMNPAICIGPNGEELEDDQSVNLYRMSYADIATYDCGSQGHPNFSQQATLPAAKPLLADILVAVERRAAELEHPIRYNIEIKSSPRGDYLYHPSPPEFSERVHALIQEYVPWERVTIQSFDFRVLRYWHQNYQEVQLAALTVRPLSPRKLRHKLGFLPQVYSSHYKMLSDTAVEHYQAEGVQVIPWTVNEVKAMQEMLDLGVDGIITDYPNLLLDMLKE